MAREKLDPEEYRGHKISVRVNESEYNAIQDKARMFGLKAPELLRNLALNYPVSSKVEELSFLELAKTRADLGRLGGLFKMWLSNKKRSGLDADQVKALVEELDTNQQIVTNCAKKLVKWDQQ